MGEKLKKDKKEESPGPGQYEAMTKQVEGNITYKWELLLFYLLGILLDWETTQDRLLMKAQGLGVMLSETPLKTC